MPDASSEHQYRIRAWVSPDGYHPPPTDSTVTFKWIYQNRPNGPRYAVGSYWNVEHHRDHFLVWDLFNVMRDPGSGHVVEPHPTLTHHDLDAAVMATVLLYERKV